MLIKKLFKIIINSVIGSALLYLVNLIGASYNFHVGLNWWTVLGTGFLGIPGVVLIVVLKFFIWNKCKIINKFFKFVETIIWL